MPDEATSKARQREMKRLGLVHFQGWVPEGTAEYMQRLIEDRKALIDTQGKANDEKDTDIDNRDSGT